MAREVVRPGGVGRVGWAGPGAFSELGIINYKNLKLRAKPKLQSALCLQCVRGAGKWAQGNLAYDFAYLSLQNGFECTPCARGATNSFPNSKCQPQAPKREVHKMCKGCHNVWCGGVVRPGGWAGPGRVHFPN